MAVKAGKLRHFVRLYGHTLADNGAGGKTTTLALLGTAWASISGDEGDRTNRNDRTRDFRRHQIGIRWCDFTAQIREVQEDTDAGTRKFKVRSYRIPEDAPRTSLTVLRAEEEPAETEP